MVKTLVKHQKIDAEKVAVAKDVKEMQSAGDEIMEEEKAKHVKKNRPMEVTESGEEEHIPLNKRATPTSHEPRKSTQSATNIASQEPLPKHAHLNQTKQWRQVQRKKRHLRRKLRREKKRSS